MEATAVAATSSSDISVGDEAGNAATVVAVIAGTVSTGGLCSISRDRRLSSMAANLELI